MQPQACDALGQWQPSSDLAFLQTDPHNCGACAHDCGSGACTAGMCPTEQLVHFDTTKHVFQLALLGTDVFWSDSGGDMGGAVYSGGLGRVAKSGGSPMTLVSGLQNPQSLSIEGGNLWWISGQAAGTTPSILHVPISGGTPATLLTESFIGFMVQDGTHAFYDNETSVRRVSLNGGAPEDLSTKQKQGGFLGGIALGADHVFWLDGGDTSFKLMKYPRSGGKAIEVLSALGVASNLAVDLKHVYWTQGDSIVKMGLTETTAMPIISGVEGLVCGIASDGDRLYFAHKGGHMSVANADGTDLLILSDTTEAACSPVIDDSHVYWTGGPYKQGIWRVVR